MSDITFPYHGCFKSNRGGYTWHYSVHRDGFVDIMWRTDAAPVTHKIGRYMQVCGGDKIVQRTSPVTKECLNAIEKATGRKTDGWNWITKEEETANAKLLEEYPIDGSYRRMKRTMRIAKAFTGTYRIVYEHAPTGNLYYTMNGVWYRTYPYYALEASHVD